MVYIDGNVSVVDSALEDNERFLISERLENLFT